MKASGRVAVTVLSAVLQSGLLWAVEPSACVVPAGATLPSCHEGSEIEIGNCWQRTIVASRALNMSYKTMKLKVTFTHAATQRTRQVYAFYDGISSGGKDVIRIRSSFPVTGIWSYSLSCEAGDCLNNTGLTNAEVTNRSLTVTALQGPPGNALFTKGHPTVLEAWAFTHPPQHLSNGPMVHSNGEPFFWLGDSAWAAPLRALPSEWVTYINDRKARSFSVVQIGIAPEWAGGCFEHDIENERKPPFTDQPHGSNCAPAVGDLTGSPDDGEDSVLAAMSSTIYPTTGSLPQAGFWKRFEEMVQYANCQGITVFVASIMAPVNQYPTFANVEPFARNLAARLSGNAVILSPSADDTIQQGTCGATLSGTDQLIRDVGNVLAATAPHLLTTGHFGTMAGNATGNSSAVTLNRMCNYRSFLTDPWVDFWMGQTGYNNNRLERITERPRTLMSGLRGLTDTRFRSAPRPVVNGEAAYDAGNDPQAVTPHHKNRFRARQAAWLSWLSGATGYTLGVQGIWEWGVCGQNPPPGGSPNWCSEDAQTHTAQFERFNQAMTQPSSQDMKRLRTLLSNTRWSHLVVNEQSRIKNQACSGTPCTLANIIQDQAMVVARDSNWLIAYMPHNQQINLEVSPPFSTSGTFFTPRTGASEVDFSAAGTPIVGQPGVFRFLNPGGFDQLNFGNEDWVLGLPRSASASLGWVGASTNRLEARPLSVDSDGSMALMGQVTTVGGLALSTEVEFSSRTKLLPFGARAARDGAGNFVLGWQERGESDADWKVWMRRIDSSGKPQGIQIDPSQTSNRTRNLSVAANSAGAFVAIWEEWMPTSGRFELRVRSFSSNGTPSSENLALVNPPADQSDTSPLVACDSTGSCVATWERQAAGDATAALWLASFSLASPWNVSAYEYRAAGPEPVAVENLIAEGVGRFELAWETLSLGNESLGVSGVELNSAALPTGSDYAIRGPWEESE